MNALLSYAVTRMGAWGRKALRAFAFLELNLAERRKPTFSHAPIRAFVFQAYSRPYLQLIDKRLTKDEQLSENRLCRQ
jgi:hypothetical protein